MNEHIFQNESKNWNSGSCPAEETQDGFLKLTNQSQSNFWGVISAAASFLCSVLKRCHLVMNLWSEVAFQILTSRTVRRDLLFCIPCAAPQTLPCCMKVQVWDYNKSYLEFKVCSFHREVRPSSSLSALLFCFFRFSFISPCPPSLHLSFILFSVSSTFEQRNGFLGALPRQPSHGSATHFFFFRISFLLHLVNFLLPFDLLLPKMSLRWLKTMVLN